MTLSNCGESKTSKLVVSCNAVRHQLMEDVNTGTIEHKRYRQGRHSCASAPHRCFCFFSRSTSFNFNLPFMRLHCVLERACIHN